MSFDFLLIFILFIFFSLHFIQFNSIAECGKALYLVLSYVFFILFYFILFLILFYSILTYLNLSYFTLFTSFYFYNFISFNFFYFILHKLIIPFYCFILFFINLIYCSSSLYIISLVVFHLYNELRHTHKKEMDLSTHECTSLCFCHLFTDLCRGRTYFFSIWILSNFILFYFVLLCFISFYLNLLFSYHILCWFFFLLFIFIFSYYSIQFNCRVWHSSAQLSIICQACLLPEVDRLQCWHLCQYFVASCHLMVTDWNACLIYVSSFCYIILTLFQFFISISYKLYSYFLFLKRIYIIS